MDVLKTADTKGAGRVTGPQNVVVSDRVGFHYPSMGVRFNGQKRCLIRGHLGVWRTENPSN